MPLRLYRHGWGWLLGHTFLLLVHVGRKTGAPHDTVAMALSYNHDHHEAVIFSGWGPDADWVHNLQAHAALEVRIGRESFVPEHRFLTEDEAVAVVTDFRRRHPWRVRLASAILGWGDLRSDAVVRRFVHEHPFVSLRPADSAELGDPRRRARPRGRYGKSRRDLSPRTNGKAERFIQTLLREWAYAVRYQTSQRRALGLTPCGCRKLVRHAEQAFRAT